MQIGYEFGAGILSGSPLSLNVDNVLDEELPFVGNLFRQGIVADYSYGDPIGRFATVGFRKRF